jgi:hypothetical protein
MPSVREVVEGRQYQGVDEGIIYTILATPWSPGPSSVSVVVKDMTDNRKDVTLTVMPAGLPSVAGDVIMLPKLKALTYKHLYRIEVKFTGGGNDWEVPVYVQAEL